MKWSSPFYRGLYLTDLYFTRLYLTCFFFLLQEGWWHSEILVSDMCTKVIFTSCTERKINCVCFFLPKCTEPCVPLAVMLSKSLSSCEEDGMSTGLSASHDARVWILKQSYVLRTQILFEYSAHTLTMLSYASLQCCFNYKMLTKLLAKFFLQKDSSKYLLFPKLNYLCRNDMILPF